MSNIKTEKLQYNTSDFIKKEISTNEITIKSEYEKTYKDQSNLNSSPDSHSQYHQENEHSCFYNSSSSVPKTILITNNYSQDDRDSKCSNNTNIKKSSITIVTHNSDTEHSSNNMPSSANSPTVVLDRINICINNHFNDPRSSVQNSSLVSEKHQNDITTTSSTGITQTTTSMSKINQTTQKSKSQRERDSTTSNISSIKETTIKQEQYSNANTFSSGQDVLVQRKDGRYYLGTIVAKSRNQYLVKFDDNTEYWSSHDELTKLSSTDTSTDPVCVVCKKVNNDVVEVCERCGRGYHQKCADGFQKNGIWYCRRCTAPNGFKYKNNEHRSEEKDYHRSIKDGHHRAILHKSQLPYNVDSLSWDTHHRVNLEQIYCYCGGNGEWYNKMLQCVKCMQWFHGKCVKYLDYPIYCGDRFYIFVCTMCNYGKELIRRLEMKWEDVVHLLLFNITINNQQKYYHVNKVIVPYAIDNWPMLQLSQQMRCLTATEIRDNIIKTLSLHSSRFKCGREIKQRHSVWGLRCRIPPPAPQLQIPPDINICDQYLRQILKIDFIPHRSLVNIPKDINAKMIGAAYMGENSDNESSGGTSDQKIASDDELPLKLIKEKETKARELKKEYEMKNNNRLNSISTNEDSNTANDYCTIDSSDKSRDCVEYERTKEDMDIDESTKLDSFDLTSSHIKQSRKRKSPFLSSLIQQSHMAATSDTKNSDIIDICDSSDETSSRGTLDLIIPPPKNFQGRNNPFRLTPKKRDESNDDKSGQVNKSLMKQPGVLPLSNGGSDPNQTAGQFRIVRTVKRRLSVKDIMIGPNKEIKRRRLRRRSGNVEVISTQTLQTLPKSAAYLPIRNESKDLSITAIRSSLNSASSSASSTPQATTPTNLGSISNVFKGRRLRQRQEKNYSETPRRNSNSGLSTTSSTIGGGISIPGSPNKNNSQSDVSLSQLQTTVNMYFGAANRISSGENFIVRAKRLLPNGKEQYLIEWEGMS